MKNTLNYKRFLIAEARNHLRRAKFYRVMGDQLLPQMWERHMHYARQAIRMAGVL